MRGSRSLGGLEPLHVVITSGLGLHEDAAGRFAADHDATVRGEARRYLAERR